MSITIIQKKTQGFSLGELLVVVTIIILLAMAILMAYQNQIAKANDAKRKEDLNKYKIALEDYYNDNGRYLTEDEWYGYDCDTAEFAPYMNIFLCDPRTRTHYLYQSCKDENDNLIPGYKLYAKLENKGDPDITAVGCSWIRGCGEGDLASNNYGITVGCALTATDFEPNAPVEPPPFVPPPNCPINRTGPWACGTEGTCNSVGVTAFTNGWCTVGFTTRECCWGTYVNGIEKCSPPTIWCTY